MVRRLEEVGAVRITEMDTVLMAAERSGETRGRHVLEPAAHPPVAVISGVEVVTIPLAHYAELLDCQRRLAIADVTPARLLSNPRCRIDRDPPVGAFLAECLGRRLLKDTYALCLERFGRDRTPGKTTIQEFWKRLGRQR